MSCYSLHTCMYILYLFYYVVVCPITGQFYTIGGCYPDNPTCDNPNSPVLCDISRCVCPLRQVISDDRRCIDPALCSEYYECGRNI